MKWKLGGSSRRNDVIINYFNYIWHMLVKCILLILFFAVMIGVGIYCRRTASNVQGFVLGGRNVNHRSLP